MYADDTTLKAAANTHEQVQNKLQQLTDKTMNWLRNNRLVVNPNKSSVMLIGTRKKINDNNIEIFVNDILINQCECVKILGLQVDSCLTFANHIEYVCKKVCQKLGLLKRIKYYLSTDLLNTIYVSIIQCQFDYCISVWGACANYFTSINVFKSLNGIAPSQMQNMFIPVSHNLNTRSVENSLLYAPKPNIEMFKMSLQYRGCKLWNSLPDSIRNCEELCIFKSMLKHYIISQ